MRLKYSNKYLLQYMQTLMMRVASVLICICIGCASCKKFITIAPPVDQITSGAAFSTDQAATSAMAGLYSQINSGLTIGSGALTVDCGLAADELYTSAPNAEYDAFFQNAVDPRNIENGSLWSSGYAFIYQANACIEGLTKSGTLTAGTKAQLTGEALFMRAFFYFLFTNLYGDVPLVTSTDYTLNQSSPRTAQTDVFKQVISDLQQAVNLLSEDYPTGEPVRVNKWAAAALLARVYLYQKDWGNATQMATYVISSGKYTLTDQPVNVFLANSTEAILQFYPVIDYGDTQEGIVFIPYDNTSIPNLSITDGLSSAFEAGDLRKEQWLSLNTVNGKAYYYPNKYKISYGDSKPEYYMVLRLAELYLIRAEAGAHQNDLAGAIADINVIRRRAGLNLWPLTLSSEQIFAGIAHERRIELFAEWGHRWFDLKRTATIDNALSEVKANWKPTAALFPIPFSELQANPNLTQNKGY